MYCQYRNEGISSGEIERKILDFSDKLILAPLTTVGNLPFRKLCVNFGADVTISEMALSSNILSGQPSELALLRRDPAELFFGIQLAGGDPTEMAKCAEILSDESFSFKFDFVDINIGCPLECLHKKQAGSILMQKPKLICDIVRRMKAILTCPLTIKMRISHSRQKIYNMTGINCPEGYMDHPYSARHICPMLEECGIDAIFLHGRSAVQRYTKLADWNYIRDCARSLKRIPLIGNGDIMDMRDYYDKKTVSGVNNIMIGRGALMKPWIFYEIKNNILLDPSASQRLNILKEFVYNGLSHWGSDNKGVETTRRFLLEWLSFFHRYVPTGLLVGGFQTMNSSIPKYFGRNDLETKLASTSVKHWIEISEMLLGPVPRNFVFVPKHKSNAY